jgi:hypothetical protein
MCLLDLLPWIWLCNITFSGPQWWIMLCITVCQRYVIWYDTSIVVQETKRLPPFQIIRCSSFSRCRFGYAFRYTLCLYIIKAMYLERLIIWNRGSTFLASTIEVVLDSAISLLMLLGTTSCSKLSSTCISLTIAWALHNTPHAISQFRVCLVGPVKFLEAQ